MYRALQVACPVTVSYIGGDKSAVRLIIDCLLTKLKNH